MKAAIKATSRTNKAPLASIQTLLATLVATPSQALANDLDAIVKVITAWLDAQQLPYTLTGPAAKPSAIVINPPQASSDEIWMLNACVDTSPTGDLGQWRQLPFAGTVEGGWMYGRGSADSKAAVAIFCHLAQHTALNAKPRKGQPQRRVTVVFDCDEHSGRFGGIRDYTQQFGYPQHCSIGYPGQDEIVCGSRGFFRTALTLRGHMGHSGSADMPGELAAAKLQRLLKAIETFNARKAVTTADFPMGPRASVTGLRTGARTYSVTAAKIECAVDIRLTPAFDAQAAQAFFDKTLATIARDCGNAHPSTMSKPNTWPPYRTPDHALLPQLLQTAATAALGRKPPLVVCGPSNIGNYLAAEGTQVLSGFGVDFRNIHGPDECVRLASIPAVYETYRAAVRAFISQG
jgi:succinyl-diaminopimelate desuccinylase